MNMSMKEFKYKVKNNQNNFTIEQFFKFFHFGKEKTNSLIYNSNVCVNGKIINNKSVQIKENDSITIKYNVEDVVKYEFDLKIIFEDDFLLVVNKPNNILVHSDGNTTKTLTNAVHCYLSKKEINPFAFPIHRIDFDTTGIVVFAKDPMMLSFLSSEIENHNLTKKYVCLCYNSFKSLKGTINKKISKDRHSNKQIISKNGKDSVSYYEVINNGKISKVIVTIIHGRTHQIRVHMKSINHPLLGDKIYGIEDNFNLQLHFREITLYHPFREEWITIECEEGF